MRAGRFLAAALLAVGCGVESTVPTCRVERRELVREVLADGHLQAKKSTPIPVPQEARQPMRVEWLIADGSAVTAGDLIARFDDSGFRKEREGAVSDRSKADLRLESQRTGATSEGRKSELDAAVARREREVAESFQLTDPEIFSLHERIESELDRDLAREKEEHALAARDVRGQVAMGAEALIVLERRQAELGLGRADSALAALAVTAPHDGLVVFQRDWRGNPVRPGDTVWPGQRLAELPELATLQAEVFVLEADAGGLAVGAVAEVRLESHPERLFEATVERVDKVAKPRWRGSPVQYFGATLALAETDPGVMKPGQRVRARLTLERRPDVLVVPRAALFEREGRAVVHRRAGRRFEEVAVTIEATAAGLAAISGEISPGDRLALADPLSEGGAPTGAGLAGNGATR